MQASSLPSRGVWIEIDLWISSKHFVKSLPSRGVWIEIIWKNGCSDPYWVAPLAGSVD